MRPIVKTLVLPIAAFVLASAGAISTNASKESKADTLLIEGYIHDPLATSCEEVNVDCKATPGPVCMYNDGASSFQVFRKATDNSPCNLQLYRNTP
ncbi:DUF6520 family protein [Flavobacterium sp. NPDC079362]|uniref:Uncharacterized protein n=1 Tax=Flavobacterium collinsii TaxID=1114861 RepID=A0ABN7EI73_9FLAO|nr:DUF6520 family protein [Flavobacterium collinsii]CAA9197729.1 hypothetical protein FLACOL7796_01817 [Flavobacterium collinsii]